MTQRRLGLFVATAIAVMPNVGLAQVAYDHMSSAGTDITKTVIADGIYQFTTVRDAYVRQLNSTVIVNANDVLVFDTNTRPSSARLILAEIRKITSKPVRFVVNSHGHPDHWSGNEVYADAFPGLDVIATQQMRDIMMSNAGIWVPRFTTELANRRAAFDDEVRTGKRADGSVLSAEQRQQDKDDLENYRTFTEETVALHRVFPTLTFGDSLTLFHGGRQLRFLNVTGDQEGTTVLYLPKERFSSPATRCPFRFRTTAHNRRPSCAACACSRIWTSTSSFRGTARPFMTRRFSIWSAGFSRASSTVSPLSGVAA